jgi:hypothetical protein
MYGHGHVLLESASPFSKFANFTKQHAYFRRECSAELTEVLRTVGGAPQANKYNATHPMYIEVDLFVGSQPNDFNSLGMLVREISTPA